MKKQLTFMLLMGLFTLQLHAQHIQNPSFEGVPGDSQLPFGWEHLNFDSTPDTQPGFWKVKTPPADGNTYISLICRGEELSNGNSWEACYQELKSPLKQGRTYQYSVDLARSETFASASETYTNPIVFRVWGRNKKTKQTELLWTSPPIKHLKWQRYQFQAAPEKMDCNDIILEAYFIKKPAYSGNVLVDNLFYYPES